MLTLIVGEKSNAGILRTSHTNQLLDDTTDMYLADVSAKKLPSSIIRLNPIIYQGQVKTGDRK